MNRIGCLPAINAEELLQKILEGNVGDPSLVDGIPNGKWYYVVSVHNYHARGIRRTVDFYNEHKFIGSIYVRTVFENEPPNNVISNRAGQIFDTFLSAIMSLDLRFEDYVACVITPLTN